MNKIFFLMTLIIFPLTAMADQYVNMSAQSIKIDKKNYIVVSLENIPGWHTYWKNPGDAGTPNHFKFSLNGKEITLKDLEWPVPHKYIEPGDMLVYGYEGLQHFFFEAGDQVKNQELEVYANWLVCKDICIPGEGLLHLKIDNSFSGFAGIKKFNETELISAQQNLPKKSSLPEGLEFYLDRGENEKQLILSYTYTNISQEEVDTHSNFVSPFPSKLFTFYHEKLYYDAESKTLYGRTVLDWDGEYLDPPRQIPTNGILSPSVTHPFLIKLKKDLAPIVVENTFTQIAPKGENSLESYLKTLSEIGGEQKEIKAPEQKSIFLYLLFAFLGGLILNLMPCVLPVISLKLFGLIVHSDESQARIMKHNLAYTFGIVSSFWVLAAMVLILKLSGETVGWGFQMQSAPFVFAMLTLIFVMGLNLLGLFEFTTPGGRKLGNVILKKGVSGDFINGVIATVLSTPCSAPFLGTALTFAFTTTNFNIFLILTFVGLGLASPFILTGIFPQLVRFFPRPGSWMDKLKKLLGISMLLTFVWLYDVLSGLVDMQLAGIYINLFFVCIFFAFFFRKHISKMFTWDVIFFALPLMLGSYIMAKDYLSTPPSINQVRADSDLYWEEWSEANMQDLAKEGRWVFIDFTAKWCLTCKVNKKLVLNTDNFTELVEEHNIALLVGDWTQRDENITQFLRQYDVVGVPAYFIQKPDGTILYLGETISISKIKDHLR